jgi:hypothetical protein
MQIQTDPLILEDLERYHTDAAYFDAHRAEFLQRFPDRWVAVYKQEFAGAANTTAAVGRGTMKGGDRLREG